MINIKLNYQYSTINRYFIAGSSEDKDILWGA